MRSRFLAALVLLPVLLVVPRDARASTVLQKIATPDAVKRAGVVLVVEKTDPPTKKSKRTVHWTDAAKKQQSMTFEEVLVRLRVVKVLKGGDATGPKNPVKPGAVVQVLSASDVMNQNAALSLAREGTRVIAYQPELEEAADWQKGKSFVLLATWDAEGRRLVGVAGLGLLPSDKATEVAKLLAPAGN